MHGCTDAKCAYFYADYFDWGTPAGLRGWLYAIKYLVPGCTGAYMRN